MSSQSINVPKGTRDLFGVEGETFTRLEAVARRVFNLYQFSEVRTPIFESAELFSRSLGATSDVVEKEMFVFKDRGERSFALRPEGTAGIVRHFIENDLSMKGAVHRLYYMGPMFRAERPQAGRYRQFWQIGSEFFGSAEALADADTVLMVAQILNDFGVKNFSVQVNSLGCQECRPKYREALQKFLKKHEDKLSPESKRRMETNPLRVLDSKIDGPLLKDPPVMKDYLCAPCAEHYQQFLSLVKISPIKVEENPRLVRGLDYYTRTVFEFISPDLGAQSALAAGGRYDDLVQMLGGPATPGVGFALGMDRVVQVGLQKPLATTPDTNHNIRSVVIPLLEEAAFMSFSLAQKLRQSGVAVPPVMAKKKLKNQLSAASENGSKWALLIGEDELKANEVTIKNLESREQSRIPYENVIDAIKK